MAPPPTDSCWPFVFVVSTFCRDVLLNGMFDDRIAWLSRHQRKASVPSALTLVASKADASVFTLMR